MQDSIFRKVSLELIFIRFTTNHIRLIEVHINYFLLVTFGPQCPKISNLSVEVVFNVKDLK